MHRILPVLLAIVLGCQSRPQKGQPFTTPVQRPGLLYLKEANTRQLQALDKERTVVLIPGGILEEHGPFLPVFSDGYWNEKLTDTIAQYLLKQQPAWQVLVFPTIPLGNSGANDIGGRYVFPGTFALRFEVLRSVFMDLATEIGEQGYKNIFIIHSHGAPNHLRALDQAADFFNDTYHGKMINLMGISSLQQAWYDAEPRPAQAHQDGMKMHGGMSETSSMLYLAPYLVDSAYRRAPPFAGNHMAALITIARQQQWPGYFGAPGLATKAYGKAAWQQNAALCLYYVNGILKNTIRPNTIQRFGALLQESAPDRLLDSLSLAEEERRKMVQTRWLEQHRHQP